MPDRGESFVSAALTHGDGKRNENKKLGRWWKGEVENGHGPREIRVVEKGRASVTVVQSKKNAN